MPNPFKPDLSAKKLHGQANVQNDQAQRNMQNDVQDILQKDIKDQKSKHPEYKGHIDTNDDKPGRTGQSGILE